jgi:hypothetical protein
MLGRRMLLKKDFSDAFWKARRPLRPAVVVYGSCSLTKHGWAGSTLLRVGCAGEQSGANLAIPANIKLAFLTAHSPQLSPQEIPGDKLRDKIFKNHALKSVDEVYDKLEEGRSLSRTQLRARHHVPLHCQINMIRKWHGDQDRPVAYGSADHHSGSQALLGSSSWQL